MPPSCATIKRSQAIQLMTTPKLQLHSLSEERPLPRHSQYLLRFLGSNGEVSYRGTIAADSPNIQVEDFSDCDCFFLTTAEVAKFLVKHDLIKLPVTKEQQAYCNAYKAWIAAPEFNPGYEPYNYVFRQAFIKFHVEQDGFVFSNALYTNYCL